MTERQAIDKSSIGNTTISTLTMIENAQDLERLAQADKDSVGDGGSAYAEGEEELKRTLLEEDAIQASIERRGHNNANIEENLLDTEFNFTKTLPGAPEDWQPPQSPAPEDWVHVPDTARGEPLFSEVDNPSGWSPYTFRTKFTKRGKNSTYTHHKMPAGAQVVPQNTSGNREINGWTFCY